MKILHVANFNLLKTNGCSQNSMQRKITNGLIRAGHQVVTFSDRDLCRMMGVTGSMNFWGRQKVNAYLIRFCRDIRPDVIFLGHADTITADTLAQIKQMMPHIKIVDWNVDWIISEGNGVDALKADASFNVQKLLSKAAVSDVIFVTTGDKEALKQLKTKTNIVGFFPNIVDKSIETGRVFEHENLPYDFLFAATPTLPREFCGTFQSVDKIAEQITYHVPYLKPFYAGVAGYPKVHAADYQQTCERCAMGFSLSHVNSVYLYQSDRLAHFMGNGLLTFLDSASGYRDFLTDDEVAFYTTPDELYQKIAYYKANSADRMRVARAGHDKYVALFNEVRVTRYMMDLLLNGTVDTDQYPWAVFI